MSDQWFTNGGGNSAPSFPAFRGEVMREFRKLWQRVATEGDRGQAYTQPWSYTSVVAPTTDTSGPKFPLPISGRITNVQVLLQSASTTGPYVVRTYLNGVLSGTATMAVGKTSIMETLNLDIVAGDALWPVLVAAATGDGVGMSITYTYYRL